MPDLAALDQVLEDAARASRLRRAPLPLREAGTVYDVAQRFRLDIVRRQEAAAWQTLRAYSGIRKDLRAQVNALERKLKAAAEQGLDITPAWAAEQRRLGVLLGQVDRQVLRYARQVERVVVDAERALIDAAQQHGERLVAAQLGPKAAKLGVGFDRLDTDAVEQLLGQVSGGPLRALLDGIAPAAGQVLADTLTTGIGAGHNPQKVARAMRRVVDTLPPQRAVTIARTEMLRAYRESARAGMKANRDVVDGWVWVSALDGRSCPVCVAMHGTRLPTEEVMGTHPQCRCVPVPRSKTWAELGFPGIGDSQLQVEDGPTWFARQTPDTQLATLGPAKFDAYKNGRLDLADLVGYRVDKDWGPVRFEQPLAVAVSR